MIKTLNREFKNHEVIIIAVVFLLVIVLFAFRVNSNTFTKKIDFDNTHGGAPVGSLVSYNGIFYGMTQKGGANNNSGVIFSWDPVRNEYKDIYDFSNESGSGPTGSLTSYEDKFYGVTSSGGNFNAGVIFEFDPSNNSYTKEISLDGINGGQPIGSLVLDKDENGFYGITQGGGERGSGTIFDWKPSTNEYSTIFDFSQDRGGGIPPIGIGGDVGGGQHSATPVNPNGGNEGTGDNGSQPIGSLVSYNGIFYGMTQNGGTNGGGVIFSLDPETKEYTRLYEFSGAGDGIDINNNDGDGYHPVGSLILNENENKFYGMTSLGGTDGAGVIFEFDPSNNSYTKEINFGDFTGANPNDSLLLNGDKFYGMTQKGGADGSGVVFEWDPTSNTYTELFNFDGVNNGSDPLGSLTFLDGKLYGTTSTGGTTDDGIIFEYAPNSTPVASNVVVSGNPYVNQTLVGSYTYTDADGDIEGASTFRWLRDNVEIGGATSNRYTTVPDDVGKTIKFEVTPMALTGLIPGDPATSLGTLILNSAPTASSLLISGNPLVGQTLAGSYTYTDADGDIEGTSIFRWFRDKVVIKGADRATYTTVSDDISKTIEFEVTPVALTGTTTGIPVRVAYSKDVLRKQNGRPPIIEKIDTIIKDLDSIPEDSISSSTSVVSTDNTQEELKEKEAGNSVVSAVGTDLKNAIPTPTSTDNSPTAKVSNSIVGKQPSVATTIPTTVPTAKSITSPNTVPTAASTTTPVTATTQPTFSSGSKIIKQQDTGTDVLSLQTYLYSHNYLADKKEIDAVFGPKTKKAVILFQKDHNLPVDGIVGNLTKKEMAE